MKTLSLVIPCHNEFKRLNPEAFLAAMEKRAWLSFCFVDDGSTDATAERLAHLENLSPSIHVIYLPRNMGGGRAHGNAVSLRVLALRPSRILGRRPRDTS